MKTKHAEAYRFVRFVVSALSLMALLVPLPTYGADTGTVRGKITDKADGEGVFGASVTIAGTNIGTTTDANGNFILQNVPAKQEKISVSIVGYAPTSQLVPVNAGQTSTANFTIGQTTVMASEVVVGAALYKQDRLEVPVTVNVVSQERIKQQPNPTLDQVIEDVPGVVVTRAGGQTTSTMQIRGSNTYQGGGIGTRVQGLYDGFPINNPESGEIVWTTLNMNAADKVEVMKGAAATLYGSGAMGGVVNVSGHLPETFEVKAGVSGGFYDAPPSSDQSNYRKDFTPWLWNSYVGIGNKSGPWNYELIYSHFDDQGYRQNAQALLNDIKLKARYDINAKQYIQISAFYNQTEGGYAYNWPYDLSGATQTYVPHPEYAYDIWNRVNAFQSTAAFADYLTANQGQLITAAQRKLLPPSLSSFTSWPTFPLHFGPSTLSAAQLAAIANSAGALTNFKKYDVYTDDLIKRRNTLVGINYVNLLRDNLSLDTRVYYTFNDTRFEYNLTNYPQIYPLTTRNPGDFNETSSNRFGAGTKLDWRATDTQRFLLGVDGNITDVRTTQVAAEFPVPNTFHNIQEKNAAAFLQDEWKITDSLTSLMSLRYDWSGIDAKEAELTATGNWIPLENRSVDALSPRIAMNYKAMDDMSFRASWGRSFRAPTLEERFVRDGGMVIGTPNPNLDKETMTAYEVGAYKQFSDKVSLDVAGFINNYDNLIQSVIDLPTSSYQYKNITKARIWGIETSLNYRPNNAWVFNAAYTYLNAQDLSYVKGEDATLDSNPDPKWLPYRPEHTASASATWKPVNKLALNLTGRYVSKYKAVSFFPNPEGSNYPGDFVIFNAGAKYQIDKNVIASLHCNNIGNVQYQEAEWCMAPGRYYVAGVDFTF